MTVEKRHLLEAASLIGESAREDGAWKVRLISEGQGSSGFYGRDLLENHHSVFNDVLSFDGHPTGWDGPEARSFTQIVGEILGDVWVEDDERGMASITGWYLPDPEYKDKIERYKNKIGVSIYAMGEGEFDENTGNFHVTSFEEDPYNSLDVVIAAGARGKFLESMRKVYESRGSEKASTAPVEDKNEMEGRFVMDQEVKEAFDAINAKFDRLLAAQEAQAHVEAEQSAVDAEAEKRVAAVRDGLEAIESARKSLLPTQVKALTERAYRGEDIATEIEDAKTVATEAIEAAKGESGAQETGRIGEAASVASYSVGAWS